MYSTHSSCVAAPHILTQLANLQDERLQDAMAELRGKFKAIVTMMGMASLYFPEGPSLESTAF